MITVNSYNVPAGAILQYSCGSSFFAWLITTFRQTPYSHSILCLGKGVFIESDWKRGVVFLRAKDLCERNGIHNIHELKDPLSDKETEQLNDIAKMLVGCEYDIFGIYGEALKIAGFRWLPKFINNKGKFFCSELCHYIISLVKKNKVPCRRYRKRKDHSFAPDELTNGKNFWEKHSSGFLLYE